MGHGEGLIRYAQDDAPFYVKQVRAFAVTTLTGTDYDEVEVAESPLLQASGNGWNAVGMHHVDAHRVGPDRWVACVDGHRNVADV